MKKIINGKTYNTATATLICERDHYNYSGNWQSTEGLYKSPKGTYFFAVNGNSGDIFAPRDFFEIINEEKAKEFCEEYGEAEDYEKIWGKQEEG